MRSGEGGVGSAHVEGPRLPATAGRSMLGGAQTARAVGMPGVGRSGDEEEGRGEGDGEEEDEEEREGEVGGVEDWDERVVQREIAAERERELERARWREAVRELGGIPEWISKSSVSGV